MTAIANAQPLPQGWIKEGMIVRCTAPQAVGLMQVRVVHSNGGISARRARMTKDSVVMLNADCFQPATIEDRVLFTLDAANIGEIRKIIPDGKDERDFKIIFMADRTTTTVEALKPLFEKVQSPERLGNAVIVTVPQSWLNELVIRDPVTPAVAAQAAAETDLILEKAAAIPPNQRPTPVEADSAVVDWFMRHFTREGIDMTDVKIAPAHRLGRTMGQDPTYALIWPSTQAFADNIKLVSTAAKELRLRDFFADDRYIKVDLPDNWTPTFGEPVAVTADNQITESVVAAMQTSAPEDEDLSETARLIADLRERNDRLQIRNEALAEQVDSLIAHFDAQDLRAEDASEAYEAADTSATVGTRYISSVCKQVKTERNAQDGTIEKYLNDGWDILHIEFNDRMDVNVVFVRDMPTPVAPTSTRAAYHSFTPVGPQVIVESASPAPIPSAPLPTVIQVETPAINFGKDIAVVRADLAVKLNDPEVTHEEFVRAVITSRLPKDDKDAYIEQSRQMRVGGKIAALYVRSPFHAQPSILIPASRLAAGAQS